MHSIIASGSTGNSVVYHNSIMVDCGIPFNLLTRIINNLQLVLLTHKHSDHLNLSTIKKLAFERPSLRFGCCEWMVEHLEGIKNVDVYEIGKLYDYGQFQISPVKLYHDVNNCGYRIFKDGTKIFHATDTCTLDGISAKEYDLYALEHNYDEETVWDNIKAIEDLMKKINLPFSIKEFGVSEEDFNAKLDEMVELAFDDQCTGANPAYPLMEDIKAIYIDAFNGVVRDYYPTK